MKNQVTKKLIALTVRTAGRQRSGDIANTGRDSTGIGTCRG